MPSGLVSTSCTTTTAMTFPRSVGGTYTFSSLTNFLAGVYNNAGFTQTFGATEVSQTNPNIGVYAQDEWKVSPRVTLNLGRAVRPAVPRDDRHRHGQRLATSGRGLVAVRVDGDTLVRGSAGLFYDRVPLRALANALLSAGNTTDLGQSAPDRREPVPNTGRSARASRISWAASCPR